MAELIWDELAKLSEIDEAANCYECSKELNHTETHFCRECTKRAFARRARELEQLEKDPMNG